MQALRISEIQLQVQQIPQMQSLFCGQMCEEIKSITCTDKLLWYGNSHNTSEDSWHGHGSVLYLSYDRCIYLIGPIRDRLLKRFFTCFFMTCNKKHAYQAINVTMRRLGIRFSLNTTFIRFIFCINVHSEYYELICDEPYCIRVIFV